ncbi:MAG: acyl-CoA thioesterase, partial [Desulfuromonadales bacterium]|nr:acyl-CoA thioesterase [Desulfuromonadales bacterium]
MAGYDFRLDFLVRDYECDLQGVVNNAVYLHYLEHARHEYLKTLGLDFASLARQQINLVLVRAEIDYKSPLRSGDRFWVGLRIERLSRLRFVFFQDLYRQPEEQLVLQAGVIGTAVNERGRPILPAPLIDALG